MQPHLAKFLEPALITRGFISLIQLLLIALTARMVVSLLKKIGKIPIKKKYFSIEAQKS